jgi:phage baseplate assembly protein W
MVQEFGRSNGSYGDLRFVTKSSENTIKGLDFPVSVTNTGGMFSRSFNGEAIKAGLIQLIMTQQGERPMNYAFGTILRRAVFDPLDANLVSDIENSIRNAITVFEPRVLIRTLRVSAIDETSGIDVSLVFSLKDGVLSTQTINLTVDSRGVQVNG